MGLQLKSVVGTLEVGNLEQLKFGEESLEVQNLEARLKIEVEMLEVRWRSEEGKRGLLSFEVGSSGEGRMEQQNLGIPEEQSLGEQQKFGEGILVEQNLVEPLKFVAQSLVVQL